MAYVYRHIRLDKNEPFYIGIGSDSNGDYKRANDKNRWHNPLWKRITEKTGYEVEIMIDNIEWDVACSKEIEFIKLYGRINRRTGILANLTDGGDGNLGLVHSAEALKKIGEATIKRGSYWKGKKMHPNVVKASADARRGKPSPMRGKSISEKTKEAVRKHATGNKYCVGRVISQETRDKIGNGNKGKPRIDRWKYGRKGELNKNFGKKHRPEHVQKNMDSQKKTPVIKYTLDGVFIQEYNSISEAARLNNIFVTGVQAACKGRFNSYKKYIWKYKID